jgi:hypothetical protein
VHCEVMDPRMLLQVQLPLERCSGGRGLSSTVVVGVDGAGRASAELDVELCPAKELEYCFERRPCTSCSTLRA